MSTDPTAEHIDAMTRLATTLLAEPGLHAALAASLPAEVMLAALVDRGWCATCLCPPLSCAGWLVLGNRKCCPDCSHAEVAP